VLLTAAAMIVGMLPTVVGAPGEEQNAALARAVTGCVAVGTVTMLLFVPYLHSVIGRFDVLTWQLHTARCRRSPRFEHKSCAAFTTGRRCVEASDGFNVMFHTVPSGLHEFVDLVVPELQRRGLFRREYEGATLREHLGLPRPDNQFFPLGRASRAT
jgi:hypothetical protein